jgi:ABC-2 type transport system permease protein
VSGRRLAAQLRMELRLLSRNGENLLVTLGIPVGLLVFFARVDVLDLGASPVDFLLPGMLTVAVLGSAMVSLAIATGFERSYLVLKRLGATPLRRSELIAAKALAVGGILVLQVVVLVGVALALGWRIEGANLARAGLLSLAGLGLAAFAFAGIGLAMAGRLRALTTLAVANGVFVLLLLVSGVVFPLTSLPAPVAGAARLLPSAALATLLRSAFDGSGTVVGPLLVVSVWAVAMPLLATAVFRWDEEQAVKERKLG